MLCAIAVAAGIGSARAEPLKITASFVVPVANWAPLLLEKKELMTHLGKSYTFEAVSYRGTPPMISALATAELTIADLAFSSFPIAIENAELSDLRVIADEFQDGVPGYYTDEFFVLNESPIKTVEDLKGKVIATNAVGSGIDIAQRAMLVKHGLDLKRGVTIVEAAFPNMKAMLFEHKVDMIQGALPFSLDPDLRAKARVLFTQSEAVGRTQMIIWAAREGFISAHRAAMVDFMEDMLRVRRWFLDPKNHDGAVQIAVDLTKRPAESWSKWLFLKNGQAGDYFHDPDAKPDLAALQSNIDLQRDLGFLKSSIDVRKYADLTLIEEAEKRLK